MKVLMIGGTGIISTAVTKELLTRGADVTLLNRGNKQAPQGVTHLVGDVNDEPVIHALIEDDYYDCIIDWIAFTKEHVVRDYRLFKGKSDQYIFISSASAYKKPLPTDPITEAWPLDNQYWTYSKNKQICEETLRELEDDDFSVTIIRPSHTYNEHMMIVQLKSHEHPFGIFKRIEAGLPIILPDGGIYKWTITYNQDFAKGFVDVIGQPETYGKTYHLTSEITYTWKELFDLYYDAFNQTPNYVNVPLEDVLEAFPEYVGELKGDKDKDTVFDNSKIKAVAKHYTSETRYETIAKKVVAYYQNSPELHHYDEAFKKRYDALIERFTKKD